MNALFFIWVTGAVLMLASVILVVATIEDVSERQKVGMISVITLLWPLALVFGFLLGWKKLMVGE